MRSGAKVEVGQLGRALRHRWTWPPALALIFMAATAVAIGQMTPRYEARIVIIAKSEESEPSLRFGTSFGATLLSDFAKSDSLTTFDKFVALIGSEDVASAIAAQPDLMMRLFPESWDPQTRRWQQPTGLRAWLRQQLDHSFGLPPWRQPGIEPVVDLLADRTRVKSNDNGRYFAVSVRHEDPETARRTLAAMMKSADDLLRRRDRASAYGNIRFLRARLAAEPLAEVREIMAERLGQEYARATSIASAGAYGYDVFRAPYVTPQPVTPRPLLSLLVACLAGLIVGSVAAVLVRAAKTPKTPKLAEA